MTETNESITIVDRGRGPQLSNRRITVQHLLPMFKEEASDEEIAVRNEEARKRYPPPPLTTDGMTWDEKLAWMRAKLAQKNPSEQSSKMTELRQACLFSPSET